MDANRFDDIARALGLTTARRGIVAGLLGGGLSSILANLEAGARRRARRNDGLSAEKKRKKKCKKCGACAKCKKGKCKPKLNGTPCSGGSCQGGACKPGDEAPPCTDESCPLPPGCSEQALDECVNALYEDVFAAAAPCEEACQDSHSVACRECLEPILTAQLPDAQACVVESCDSAARATRVMARAGRVSARAWWNRSCDKPTCCYISLRDCQDDATEALFECQIAAVAAAIASGGIGGLGAMAICLTKLVYQMEKCQARYGCPNDATCGEGDICCNVGDAGPPCHGTCCPGRHTCCDDGSCCPFGSHCCEGGGCCHDGDTCCFRESSQTLFCCPPGAQCMQTGIPCCSNC